jgi:Carboxypeptidase regulatory-like domain/TonB dependent receptor-like, beta-barrel
MRLRTKAVWSLAAALCLSLLASAPLAAQTVTTGNITGVITDAQGGVLPGAVVTATHTDTGTSYEAVTGADGHYSILNVRVGSYTIAATMSGFKEQKQEKVQVQLGADQAADFKLPLATLTETVDVVGGSPIVDTTRAGTASNVSKAVIESLPTIARSVYDFARTSPHFNVGATSATDDTSVSVAGRNNRYNNMQIDGAVSNDVFGLSTTGTPGGQTGTQPVSLDAIQEIQLVVSSYDVRQGGFTGGGVNAITKSGTNALHGTAYYFGRSQSLIGKIPGIKTVANPNPADTKVGEFSDKQAGFTLGGPIVTSKAFYFGNYDMGRKSTPSGFSADGSSGVAWPGQSGGVQQVIDIAKSKYGYDPGGLGEFSRPNDNDKFFLRTDFNLSPRHQFTYRMNYVDGTANIGSIFSDSYLTPDRFYSIEDKNLSNVWQLNSTLGKGFNELRVYYQRERNVRGHNQDFERFPSVRVDFPDGSQVNFGTEFSSQANKLNQDVVELTDDFTFIRGRHTFTVGSHNEFYKFYNLFIQAFNGDYRFSSIANFNAGIAQSYTHNFSNTSDPQEAARFGVRQFGLYAGDRWRLKDNLTLTYGIRADIPRFPDTPLANPIAVADFGYHTDVVPSPTSWSPRLGFNWDLSGGAGKQRQVRGGIGIFTGRTPYVWLSNQYGNTGVQFTNLSTGFNANFTIPFVPDPDNQPTTVTGGTTGRQTINLIDPDYQFPRIVRGNLAMDHELGIFGLVGTAEFVFAKNQKDIFYQNINFVPTGATQPDGRTLYKKFDTNLNDVMLLTNTDKGSSWSVSFKLDRPFRNGVFVSGSYSYGDAKSVNDGTSSVARSNWTTNPIGVDTNNPPLTRSNYAAGNRLNIAATVPINLGGGFRSWASLYYNGQNGRPYAILFNGDANTDSITSNDLIFVPASADQVNVINGTWEQLDAFLSSDPATSKHRGEIIPRNAARAPWSNQLDFRYAVNVPTGSKAKVELTADIFNLLNLFNNEWGWQYWPPFPSGRTLIGFGTPANGKLTYNLNTLTAPGFTGVFDRSDLRSRWQAQFGARVRF